MGNKQQRFHQLLVNMWPCPCDLPVPAEERKVKMYRLPFVRQCVRGCVCPVCMCVWACVCADIDEWGEHPSNVFPQLYKPTTNHFRKHVFEEGLWCQMLSRVSVSVRKSESICSFVCVCVSVCVRRTISPYCIRWVQYLSRKWQISLSRQCLQAPAVLSARLHSVWLLHSEMHSDYSSIPCLQLQYGTYQQHTARGERIEIQNQRAVKNTLYTRSLTLKSTYVLQEASKKYTTIITSHSAEEKYQFVQPRVV